MAATQQRFRRRPLALLTAALLAGSVPAMAAPGPSQADLIKLLER